MITGLGQSGVVDDPRGIATSSDGRADASDDGGAGGVASRWTAAFGGAVFLALSAVTLYRGLRAPEAHVRAMAESLHVVSQAVLLSTPGLIAFGPGRDRATRFASLHWPAERCRF